MRSIAGFLMGFLAIAFLSSASSAETTCSKSGCDITITIKIAFSGANDSYVNAAKNEIESFWNGPNGYQTVGDCKCRMRVKVESMKTADCVSSPPQGYHCISVTDFFRPDGTYGNPPRNQTNITGAAIYVGYLYGIASGNGSNSQKGWFSDQMSRPVDPNDPAKGNYKDFAHEAGHLMGLNHTSNTSSIMNNTLASGPSQDDLEGAARAICGEDFCPDSCCCGDGKIDSGKGETCDPKAVPTGCGPGASCCPVCCSCYSPLCIAANGEFLTMSSCQAACGPGSSCYKNYKTGCWDCLRQTIVVTGTCRDPESVRGNRECDHVASFLGRGTDFYRSSLAGVPVLGGAFSDERVNIRTEEGDEGHLVTRNGSVESYGLSLLPDPTVEVDTDRETVRYIAGGMMSVQQALSGGRMEVRGKGILGGLRFWAYGALFGIYDFLYPAEEFKEPPPEPDYPEEYLGSSMMEKGVPVPPSGYGPPPDEQYNGG